MELVQLLFQLFLKIKKASDAAVQGRVAELHGDICERGQMDALHHLYFSFCDIDGFLCGLFGHVNGYDAVAPRAECFGHV